MKKYIPYFLKYTIVVIESVNYKNNDLKKVSNTYIYGKVSKNSSLNTKTLFNYNFKSSKGFIKLEK